MLKEYLRVSKNIRLSALKAVLGISVILNTSVALAVTQYHCNGRIQFRPCTPEDATFSRPNALRAMAKREATGRAEVFKTTFARISRTDGLWRGLLRGTGKVHLVLMVSDQGRISSTYMGSIVLDGPDEEVSFRFISVTPKIPGWSWQIITQS